jgi:hypothetical protein
LGLVLARAAVVKFPFEESLQNINGGGFFGLTKSSIVLNFIVIAEFTD